MCRIQGHSKRVSRVATPQSLSAQNGRSKAQLLYKSPQSTLYTRVFLSSFVELVFEVLRKEEVKKE